MHYAVFEMYSFAQSWGKIDQYTSIIIHRCLLVYVILTVCIHMCRAIAEGVKGLQPRKRPTDVFPDTLLLSGESLNNSVKNVKCTGSTL